MIRYPELAAVCRHSKTLLLYPGEEAQNLQDMSAHFIEDVQNVIIIDGTWSQAKDMFLKNSLFHLPKQVCLLLVCSVLLFMHLKETVVFLDLFSSDSRPQQCVSTLFLLSPAFKDDFTSANETGNLQTSTLYIIPRHP